MISNESSPSKSELKRQSRHKQALVAGLAELSVREFDQLQVPRGLVEEITELRTLPAGGARQRRIRYAAKMLSPSTEARVSTALAGLRGAHRRRTARFHRVEELRNSLLKGGDDAINGLMVEFPNADRRQLRQLIRTAKLEGQSARSTRAFRELFRVLADLCEL